MAWHEWFAWLLRVDRFDLDRTNDRKIGELMLIVRAQSPVSFSGLLVRRKSPMCDVLRSSLLGKPISSYA
jgi:hypothetical protein